MRYIVPVFVVLVASGTVGLFVADFGAASPDPVPFDDTVEVGLTLETQLEFEDDEADVELPRVQVFYSQYPYVVGYYGIDRFVATQNRPAHEQRFGYPIAIYVTDYADTEIELTEEGYPSVTSTTEWIPAEDAVYVVDSDVHAPDGHAVVPFSDRERATAFAEDHGGTVHEWTELLDRPFEFDDAESIRERNEAHHRNADRIVDERLQLRDRPIETVVGDDADTIQEAIDAAPPESTVFVPDGTYEETLEIDRPVTLLGASGTRLDGGGNGSTIVVEADRVAVVGLNITGVGHGTPATAVTGLHAHGDHEGGVGHDHGTTDEDDAWDAGIESDYAAGDGAIEVRESESVLIAETEIHTPAAGVILGDAPGAVVRDVTVFGNESYRNGHMGVVAMRSPGVIENSTFERGLDGVYTHRANGIVVRDNEISDNRIGIHLMFTSDSLLADNTISGQESTGIHVMTGPEGNSLVNNSISNTPTGIDVGGSDSYVGGNVVRDNRIGIRMETKGTIYERNVIANNANGVEAWSVLPTNRVFDNDFVANGEHVSATSGPLRIWSHEGRGNYWEGAVGSTDGSVIERPYTATNPVDGALHRVDGAETLAQAPAVDALSGFEGSVPGLRADEIIDVAPRCAPANETWLERNGFADTEPVCIADEPRSEPSAGSARR